MFPTQKVLCSTCQKAAGVVRCRGCEQDFCFGHIAEHQKELSAQLDQLVNDHDELKQSITEQEIQPTCHPLMKYIDQWEQESINKVHQAADDARNQLLPILANYRPEVTGDLTDLTNELRVARQEEDFVETDLNQWREKLDRLKTHLHSTFLIDFNPMKDVIALIPKYRINHGSTESFGQIDGDARIAEDGKVAIHGPSNGYTAVYGRNTYSFGQHRIRFSLEMFNGSYFICGLVSTSKPTNVIISTPQQVNHHTSHANQMMLPPTRSLNNNVVYLSSNNHGWMDGRNYEVVIDCNKRTIQLEGQQQAYGFENKEIDLEKHPFPWQFFIVFFSYESRVHLC